MGSLGGGLLIDSFSAQKAFGFSLFGQTEDLVYDDVSHLLLFQRIEMSG